jgi:hypothetical protein
VSLRLRRALHILGFVLVTFVAMLLRPPGAIAADAGPGPAEGGSVSVTRMVPLDAREARLGTVGMTAYAVGVPTVLLLLTFSLSAVERRIQ